MGNNDLNIKIDEDLTNQLTIHKNLTQEIIVTNTDKVRLILNDHNEIVKKKIGWLNPVGLFISVLTTLLTAKFEEEKFGIKPEIWNGIFIVSCIATFFWSVVLIINALRYYNKGSVEHCIEKLKINTQASNSNES